MDKKRLLKQALTMLLAFAMVFTMIPLLAAQPVSAAAAAAPGGDVCIGSEIDIDTIKTAFNNAVDVNYSDGNEEVLNITLNKDIDLSDTLNLYRASTSGKKCRMIIDLNNHNITAADNKDAIRLYSVLGFYVEIAGQGKVKGGKGTVNTINGTFRHGNDGGYGIHVMMQRSDYIEYGLLDCGLTLKEGAVIEGGSGASLSYADWLFNLNNASGEDKLSCSAGNGGCGIGSDDQDGNSFIRFDIQNGSVIGGEGGSINIGDNIINYNSLMKIDAFKQYYSSSYYGCDLPSFTKGNGGDGIRFHNGRTYINVYVNGLVSGGDGGTVSQGETAVLVNDVQVRSSGDGGDGIDLYGDACLGRLGPDYTSGEWQTVSGTISPDSEYMGIYIAGTVKGGSTKNSVMEGDDSCLGGNGITLNPLAGKTRGIIAVEGNVCGGDGGSGLRGQAGIGGAGIKENGSPRSNQFGKYYIINGTVAGGNGGNGWGLIENVGEVGSNGGNGFEMNIRADDADDEAGVRMISGTGSISGGASGSVLASGTIAERNGQPAIDYGSSFYYADDVVKVSGSVKNNLNTGAAPTVIDNSNYSKGISAKASISDRSLKCAVNAPGFTGRSFIRWTVTTYQQSGAPNNGWPLETGAGSYSNFTLLNSSDYQNSLKNATKVATVERIADDLQYNRTSAQIFCTVVLDDGRCVKCEPIELPAKWNGSGNYSGGDSGGGGTPGGGGNVQPGTVTPPALTEIRDLSAVKISKLTAGKKKVKVKWKKPKKAVLGVIQGYEIRVKGNGIDRTYTVGKKKTSYTIKKLKSKKKYTVSLRAYRKEGNIKHVSAWKSKKIRIK